MSDFVAVHPNPVSEWIELEVGLHEPSPYSISLLTLSGSRQVVGTYPSQGGTQTHRFNTNDLGLAAGAYFIEIRQNEKVYTKKLMVVR
jgi:hypothetical protein